MTNTATLKAQAAPAGLEVLNVGEQNARMDPDQRNGTLSTLVCGRAGNKMEFPAKCYQGWTVRVGRKTVTGTYATVVAAIREYVARVDPAAVTEAVRLQEETARILAQRAADYAAREAEGAAAVERARAAGQRASTAAHLVDEAYADRQAPENASDHAYDYARQATERVNECVSLNSRRPAYWFESVARLAECAEQAAAECERVARHYGLISPAA
ncbi:hypothetical protein [Streptomyces sp. NBC_01750]|uniref:hypothetical protein n=1 Tax=Streptomyces sp. NBC_01750 TaxID=2975928 RepID=UPI002DD90FDB|nr:hypothetical protein [Streptomyces sp. NBC_01750]WSD38169.1 hypothetical protein OG966_40465 [Streptomyces sp. NBC_01750]